MNILEEIIAEKAKEVDELQGKTFATTVTKNIPTFREQVKQSTTMNVIAEIKRSSPSKGAIQMEIDPVKQAKEYEDLGAVAISVLTDQPFFNGSMADLRAVREAVDVPLLCKDFMIDPVQIDQAKAAGANIILLIVAALTNDQLTELYQYAKQLDLEVLVEVHDEAEMERALQLGAQIIGINNRDLKAFEVDLGTTTRLAKMVTNPEVIFISESGIRTRKEVQTIAKTGAEAVLVGETLMRSENLEKTFASLRVPMPKKEG